MKQVIFTLSIFLIGLSSFSQNKNEEKCYFTRCDYLDKNSQLKFYTTYQYDSQNRQIGLTYYKSDGSLDIYYKDDLDKDGKIKKRTWYDKNGKVTKYVSHSYNDKGLETEQVGYLADNSEDFRRVYQYNKDGKKIREDYSSKKIPFEYNLNTYNEKGDIAEIKQYKPDGKLYRILTYEYNKEGKRTKYNAFDPNRKLTGYYLFYYDEKGRFNKEIYYLADGTTSFINQYQYDCKNVATTNNGNNTNSDSPNESPFELKPFPKSTLSNQYQVKNKKYKVILAYYYGDSRDKTMDIQGNIDSKVYTAPDGAKDTEVQAYYAKQLIDAGYKKVFGCSYEGECGINHMLDFYTEDDCYNRFDGVPAKAYYHGFSDFNNLYQVYEKSGQYIVVMTSNYEPHKTLIDVISK